MGLSYMIWREIMDYGDSKVIFGGKKRKPKKNKSTVVFICVSSSLWKPLRVV